MPDENDIVYDTYGIDIFGFLGRVANAVKDFFGFGDGYGQSGIGTFFDSLGVWWDIYSVFAILLALVFIWAFIYAKIRFGQVAEIEAQQLEEAVEAWHHAYGGGGETANSRWGQIEEHIGSSNPNDWRLAIIEADIMLEETLDDAGYPGASVGEKLKGANETSFTTIRDAWDAHMIRNKIAHSGSDFVLTNRSAREAIVKYERVFREFGVL